MIDFEKWMAERGSEREYFNEPVFDESSASARFRHASWWNIRRRVWASMVRTQQSPSRRAAFGSCGSCSWLEQSNTVATDFRVRHNHCHDRLCTPCANARSAHLTQSVMQVAAGKHLLFITLTLCGKNERLNDLLDKLYRSFRALRQVPLWADAIRGGAAFLEVKRSEKAGRWHPHLHIIADGRYVPQHELSNLWRSITKDSYIVDVRRVNQLEVAARYVTKYASKPLNTTFTASPELLDEALLALKGRRLCFAFGDWYGTALRDLDDDPLELDDGGGFHFFCSMEELLQRANTGIREAVNIVKLAKIESLWRASLLIDTS